MAARRWSEWPKKTAAELNSLGGVVGIGGVLLGGAGAVLSAPFVLGAGVLLAIGAVGYAGFKSFPEELTDPESIIGERLESTEILDRLSRRIPRVSVVGSGGTGKSTLVEKLLRSVDAPDPTADVYVAILRSGGENPKVFALVDGSGEDYPQQFAVAETADLLFIVFDHNEGKKEAAIQRSRLEDHESFLLQLISCLRGKNFSDNCIILLNKRDNWKRSTQAEDFVSWGEEIKMQLSQVLPGNKILVREHSNWDVDCINLFWTEVEGKTQ